ncbi:ATP synthase F1 subunit epsilon [Limnoglobus roseus]|uniref:ATP synthase epsilon chain n=1 Tax=Limnoglobus roseus TaxID=2598579 RepID=A0A5C1AFY0_9BACT|nr:ATP synthase F1 subunit epsilon [Limnoglobus roseus]QEL17037.1 ATP synthase F1 subunit epsilon [Limnoglobus roseus]
MAEATNKTLRVVVVTPERAVLDESADMVVLPLFDGEFGVMANHSPFVGQLGPGELRIKHGTETRHYFIDGGFAQVAKNVVNVLTQFARKKDDLTEAVIVAEQTKADAIVATNDVEKATKAKMITRAAAMRRVAKK